MQSLSQAADRAFIIVDGERVHLVTVEPPSVITLDVGAAAELAKSMGASIDAASTDEIAIKLAGQFDDSAAVSVLQWMGDAHTRNADDAILKTSAGRLAPCLSIHANLSISVLRGHRDLSPAQKGGI